MSRECYWKLKGPTMRECSHRADLIAEAIRKTLGPEFATDVLQPPDRATVIVRGLDFSGEYRLITDEEMKDGEWVHAAAHTDNCPEYAP